MTLPVLLASRSPSPFLREGETRGRCVGPKFLPFASDRDALSILRQALPPTGLPYDLADCRMTSHEHADQDQPLAVAPVRDVGSASDPSALPAGGIEATRPDNAADKRTIGISITHEHADQDVCVCG